MSEAHLTITFTGPDPEKGLREFMAWYLDGGGDYEFREYLEVNYMKIVDSDWTDDTINLEIVEEEFDDDDDEDL